MEKVVHVLLGSSPAVAAGLSAVLLADVTRGLWTRGARGVQVNVVDESLGPPFGVSPDPAVPSLGAAVSAWFDCAGEVGAGEIGAGEVLPDPGDGGHWWGYVVCESEPLRNTDHPPGPGRRVPGFAQLVLLRRPAVLSWSEWRDRWQADHTSVALATQSTFRYVQNVVLRPLDPGAPAYVALVEECFPSEAASDLHVFFDSGGDDARLVQNMAAMSESCNRFMEGATPMAWTVEYVPGDEGSHERAAARPARRPKKVPSPSDVPLE